MESAGEDAVRILWKWRQKHLGYYVNLVDKAVAGFEGIDSNLKEVLLWAKSC